MGWRIVSFQYDWVMRLMLDTHPKIEAMLVEHWRTMSAGEKLLRIADLIETGEVLSRSGVRNQYPNPSAEEVRLRVIARRLDKQSMMAVYGWHPDMGPMS